MYYKKTVYRLLEAIMATIGALINLAIFLTPITLGLEIVSIIGSVLAIIFGWFSFKDAELAGIGLVISSILVLFNYSVFGIVGAILILLAGILDLFRK